MTTTTTTAPPTTATHPLHARPLLVTGAGGFVGAALVRRLVARGAEVRALLGPAAEAGALQAPPAAVRAVHGDIEDGALLDGLLDGVACVYHLAGPPSVAESFEAPARYLRAHAAGTAQLLERSRAAGVDHIVYVSSAEVYGPAGGRVTEDQPRAPRSPYGIAKLAAELLLESWAAGAGIRATILRPFSIYGPGASPRSLLGTLLDAIVRGEAPCLADLRPVRDYCFVDDVADAIAGCGGRDGAASRAYNLASGQGVSVAELAAAALRVAGCGHLPVRERPRAAAGGDRPASAITLELVGDPTRAHVELGFAATTPLETGLALALRALQPRPVRQPPSPGEAREDR